MAADLDECDDFLSNDETDPDPAPLAALAAALRQNATLTSLELNVALTWTVPDQCLVLLDALTAHPSLRKLNFQVTFASPEAWAPAGAALGALVAADAPLTELHIHGQGLSDAALGPLFDALPRNTHLRYLGCGFTRMSAACATERLLSAVRANTSLHELFISASDSTNRLPAVREALTLVAERAAAWMRAHTPGADNV
jgi:hypothetical protein